jgi:hypothetical protein
MIGGCARLGCKSKRGTGRYCKPHHAAVESRSYRKHRVERNGRRRDKAEQRGDGQRARDSARAKLAVAIARGTLTKGRCARCPSSSSSSSSSSVTAYIADPEKWRDVVWVCRDHREDEIASRRAPIVVDEASQWAAERAAALADIALLTEPERDGLFRAAARGPAGITLSTSSPLFTIRLVKLFLAHKNALV